MLGGESWPNTIITINNTAVETKRGQKYARMVRKRGATWNSKARIIETTTVMMKWYWYCISFVWISTVPFILEVWRLFPPLQGSYAANAAFKNFPRLASSICYLFSQVNHSSEALMTKIPSFLSITLDPTVRNFTSYNYQIMNSQIPLWFCCCSGWVWYLLQLGLGAWFHVSPTLRVIADGWRGPLVITGEPREHFGIYSSSTPLIRWLLCPFSSAYFSIGMKIKIQERHSFFFSPLW